MSTSVITPAVPSLADLLQQRQTELHISDEHLAAALGYARCEVIKLFKSGAMTFPLNKVLALAAALECDARRVLELAMNHSSPGLYEVIEEVFAFPELTAGETRLLQTIRKLGKDRNAVPLVFDGSSVVALVVA